jgi:hypothetical protein
LGSGFAEQEKSGRNATEQINPWTERTARRRNSDIRSRKAQSEV